MIFRRKKWNEIKIIKLISERNSQKKMVRYMKRCSQIFNILLKLSIDYEIGALDINFPNEAET